MLTKEEGQELAQRIGTKYRAAEAMAQQEGATQTLALLTDLHGDLNAADLAAGELYAALEADSDEQDAHAEAVTQPQPLSGGQGKGEN